MRQTSSYTIPDTRPWALFFSFFTRFELSEESFQSQPRHHWRAAGLLVLVAAGCAGPSRRICWPMAEDWGWQLVVGGLARARNDNNNHAMSLAPVRIRRALAAWANQAVWSHDIGCSSFVVPCGCTISLMHTESCLP